MTTAPLRPNPGSTLSGLHLVPAATPAAPIAPAPGGTSLSAVPLLSPSWEQALAEYAAWSRGNGLRAATIQTYIHHLRALARFAGNQDPWTVTPEQVDAWLGTRGRGRRQALSQVRPFYSWALRLGHITARPVPMGDTGKTRSAAAVVVDPAPLGAWAEHVERHLARLVAAGSGRRVVALHLSYLRRFAQLHPDPWTVTEDDVLRWLGQGSWSPNTKRSARGVLRTFYRQMPTDAPTPTANVSPVRIPRKLPRPTPTPVLQEALLKANDKERLMLLLGAYAGLRCCEIARVHLGRDLQEEGFLFVAGKGGHERRIPLHPLLHAELRAERTRRRAGGAGTGFRWCGVTTSDGWLFPSQDGDKPFHAGAITRTLSEVLPGSWTGHSLRHRFGSAAYRARKDIRATQELLGHASPATTAVYTQVTDTELRASVLAID